MALTEFDGGLLFATSTALTASNFGRAMAPTDRGGALAGGGGNW